MKPTPNLIGHLLWGQPLPTRFALKPWFCLCANRLQSQWRTAISATSRTLLSNCFPLN
ncbi:hypothetical protein DSO57_1001601 [Entomophthora muscae]|uniref:Uncharacterized protein n=1 Tax=Entomophthora muscae TaxID=34485 RepID=A0ACC2SB88_9FUNG|nr:hypothetical protein DSO57_1001601 [Entomophthora muscae]